MVRLVFRPYTHLRRSICTSESLRPSIRISPDFGLSRHSSPSFGSIHLYSSCSQRARSIGNGGDAAGRLPGHGFSPPAELTAVRFHCACRFRQPTDSYTCKTPWSVFQDGSKLPPTYSVEKDRPQQTWLLAIRACLKPVGKQGAGTPEQASTKPKRGKNSSPGLRSPSNSSYRSQQPEMHRGLAPKAGSGCGNFEESSVYCHTVSRTVNSLFKVLFKFPSLYLFAIGLGAVFSLTRSLPRASSCTLKQLYSRRGSAEPGTALRAYHPLGAVATVKLNFDWCRKLWKRSNPYATFRVAGKRTSGSALGCSRFIRHY